MNASPSTVPVAARTTTYSCGTSGPRRRSSSSTCARSDSTLVARASSVVSTSPMSKARAPAVTAIAVHAAMTYQRQRALNRATRAVMEPSR